MTVDGIDKPLDLVATLTVGRGRHRRGFHRHFRDIRKGINVPVCYTEAYTSFGVKCIVAPDVPNNEARSSRSASRRRRFILNASIRARSQAATSSGRCCRTSFSAASARRSRRQVPAEGTSCLWNVRRWAARVGWTPIPRCCQRYRIQRHGFHSGGTGARPRQRRFIGDRLSERRAQRAGRSHRGAGAGHLSSQGVPHRFRRRRQFRGGLRPGHGDRDPEDTPFAIATAFDRMDHPARGVSGGGAGMAGRVSTTLGRSLSGKGHYSIQPGERLIVEMPGGGGYGAPFRRDPARVASDCARRKVVDGVGVCAIWRGAVARLRARCGGDRPLPASTPR